METFMFAARKEITRREYVVREQKKFIYFTHRIFGFDLYEAHSYTPTFSLPRNDKSAYNNISYTVVSFSHRNGIEMRGACVPFPFLQIFRAIPCRWLWLCVSMWLPNCVCVCYVFMDVSVCVWVAVRECEHVWMLAVCIVMCEVHKVYFLWKLI